MTDPARVVAAMSDVADELDLWVNSASQAAAEARYVHLQGVETATACERMAAVALHHVGEREEEIALLCAEAEQSQAAAADAFAAVAHRMDSTEHTDEFARSVLVAWQNELHMARGWQTRAQERVLQAQAWVARAQAAVSAARRGVDQAKSDLRRCKADPDRRNCNNEGQRLRAAEQALAAALRELTAAEAELGAAREELARAERRVGSCQQAVEQAEGATRIAVDAKRQAAEAQHIVTFAGDHAGGAIRSSNQAADAGRRQRVAADITRRDAQRAAGALAGASSALDEAEGSYEDARRLTFDGAGALEEAIGLLREFDRPAGL